MIHDAARLAATLPVRFTDDLVIELDADAAGRALFPAEALALAQKLTHLAVTKQLREREAGKPVRRARRAKAAA